MSILESIPKLKEKVEKYQLTFNNLYFLIWSFTNRGRLNETIALFEVLPHFHINGLNKVENDILQKKIGDFMML